MAELKKRPPGWAPEWGRAARHAALALSLGIAALASAPAAFAEEAAPAAVEISTPAPTAAPAAEAAAALIAPVTDAAPAADAPAPEEVIEEVAAEPTMDKGDTAWMMVSTVLVMMMIIPGLGLFYGGLVRTKNMLSMLMQVTTCAVIGMLAWVFWGYSLSFTDGPMNQWLGGFDLFFLKGVTGDSTAATFSDGVVIPEFSFIAFQMTFAALTAALVLGGPAERMKFAGVVIFALLWPLLSYYPIAHMVWWAGGFLFDMGALDFAGGTVVHINAGVAALVGSIILGHRTGWKNEPMPPHSLTFTYVGAGMLWIGWFGFNAGSNLESTGGAALALINTMVATAAAGLSWVVTEWVTKGKPSMLGMASGIIAGLVAITPAAGLVGPMGAVILGVVVSPISLLFCSAIKHALNYDDSLDVFGIHGVGGIVGALGTGVLVQSQFGGIGSDNSIMQQVTIQATAVGVAFVWSLVASLIVFGLLRIIPGVLRASKDVEMEGLDIVEHGERAYHH
jgi:Amt family ammonium transporter